MKTYKHKFLKLFAIKTNLLCNIYVAFNDSPITLKCHDEPCSLYYKCFVYISLAINDIIETRWDVYNVSFIIRKPSIFEKEVGVIGFIGIYFYCKLGKQSTYDKVKKSNWPQVLRNIDGVNRSAKQQHSIDHIYKQK